VGVGLGKGKNLDEILEELGEVAEGVPTAKAIVAICQEKNVYAPIAKEVLSMIEGKGAQESLQSLLSANQSYKEF
jgi:glycerol-3-phosphate dehydrogenase (NAD(P)+)